MNYNSGNSCGAGLQGGQPQPRFLQSVHTQNFSNQAASSTQRFSNHPPSKDEQRNYLPSKNSVTKESLNEGLDSQRQSNQFKTQESYDQTLKGSKFTYADGISLDLQMKPSQQLDSLNKQSLMLQRQQETTQRSNQVNKPSTHQGKMIKGDRINAQDIKERDNNIDFRSKSPIDFVKHKHKQDPNTAAASNFYEDSEQVDQKGAGQFGVKVEGLKYGDHDFKKATQQMNQNNQQTQSNAAFNSIQKFVIDEDFLDTLGIEGVDQELVATTSPIMISPEFKESLEIDVQIRKVTQPKTLEQMNHQEITGTNLKHLDLNQIDSKQLHPSMDQLHRRMHSDYSNTPIEIPALAGTGTSSTRDQVLTKKIIELLENGLNLMNSD